jgi:nitrite reductase/ring-hydroxylating ferredoxin subunit
MTALLCRVGDLEATGAKGITLPGRRELVVVKTGNGPRCYVNACPHTGATLETFPDRFLSRDGATLICTVHGAQFLADDGLCIAGPCVRRSLQAVAIRVDGEDIWLAE